MKPIYTAMIALACFVGLLPSLITGEAARNVRWTSSLMTEEQTPRPITSLDLAMKFQHLPEIVFRPRFDPTKFVNSIPFNDLSSPDHILILCFHDFGTGAKLVQQFKSITT